MVTTCHSINKGGKNIKEIKIVSVDYTTSQHSQYSQLTVVYNTLL
jgi:hypothetical protein